MDYLYKYLLLGHILAGAASLLAGLIAIISAKGKGLHRISGLIFFNSMILVSATAILISLLKANGFLLMIGIFSFYLNYSGFRSARNKSLKPSILDWIINSSALLNTFFMLRSMHTVLLAFGILSMLLLANDFRLFYCLSRKKAIAHLSWLKRHIGMMLGAYISTCTAFLVVNVKNVNPAWLPWLLPSLIGAPLIAYWTKKYTSKAKNLMTI